MRLEFMNRVKDGETLGKSIFTGEGSILLRAGVRLNRNYIRKLEQLGVNYVYIEDSRLDDVAEEDEELLNLKRLTLKSMSKVSKNLYSSSQRGVNEAIKIAEELINYIIDMHDVNTNIYDIHTYDNYTYLHSLDTGVMATFMGVYAKKFSDYDIKQLGIGALLHDVGKIKINHNIINKKGKLTEEEIKEMQKHPTYGEKLLFKNPRISEQAIKVVAQHHEKINGEGYPKGLKNNEISIFGKITSICDVYSAVRANRSYREAMSPNDSYELILAGSGTSFDNNMVDIFRKSFAIYPLGCCVKLSDGNEGYVIRQNRGFPNRPVIRILYDSVTKDAVQSYELDLMKELNLVIKELV